jgi:hypothetical protein
MTVEIIFRHKFTLFSRSLAQCAYNLWVSEWMHETLILSLNTKKKQQIYFIHIKLWKTVLRFLAPYVNTFFWWLTLSFIVWLRQLFLQQNVIAIKIQVVYLWMIGSCRRCDGKFICTNEHIKLSIDIKLVLLFFVANSSSTFVSLLLMSVQIIIKFWKFIGSIWKQFMPLCIVPYLPM